MRITNLLSANAIKIGTHPTSKAEAIEMLVDLHEAAGNLNDREAYKAAILAREEQGTTAIGEGIAIPHAKTSATKRPSVAAMTAPTGVDYGAPDGKSSNLLFMVAAPDDGGDVHLDVLSRLMTILMDLDLRKKLVNAGTVEEFLAAIDEFETARFDEDKSSETVQCGYKILGVTACPTGIAHTYMAAEALQKQAEKMAITIKVETNATGGTKNKLTADEIKACDGIIVAADKEVPMSRFDGKPVVICHAADGINKPEELINEILNGKAHIYKADKKEAKSAEIAADESFGRKAYKHLMEGVSHMLPFVVSGGILVALAFLIDTIAGVPQDSSFGTGTEISAWFKNMGGLAMGFMVPILAAYIAKSIADRPGIVVGFVGGYMATLGCTFADPAGSTTAVSGFLGGLFAGFAGGYLMLGIERAFENIPKSLEGIKQILIFPILGLAGIAVLMCLVGPIIGMINTALSNGLTFLADNNYGVILGAILAAMMAIDMGGPFNKAAYVFGTGMLALGTTASYQVMAAVMIGGMVPPIAIALSTTFFKNRWTETERKSGPVNYIMGLSFITEGAIPYAAADPIRVIPSCMIGAGVAGALSWAFGCTLMAPHGGVFVFPVVGQPLLYIAALAAGSVVGMVVLTALKKKLTAEEAGL